jgi:protein phosphatase
MVSDEAIQGALMAETIDMAATELVRLALEAGGYDNVTVVIAEFVEKGTEPDEHLSSSDGQPQLVGAAAGQARPRTGDAATGSDPDASFDPEELRYAPRPPVRRRWIRWTLAVLVVAAILAVAGTYAYSWSQKQYFVAAQDGKVVIYKGVQADIPGITLQHVEQVTDVELDSLPPFRRQQVEAGIEASSRADAQKTVAELDRFAAPEPTPSPSPTKKKPAKATDVVWQS